LTFCFTCNTQFSHCDDLSHSLHLVFSSKNVWSLYLGTEKHYKLLLQWDNNHLF
jgi:hypothetical protein